MDKTVAFCTLGCKVNQYETQAMAESMERAGYRVVDFSGRADVYVVNSCTVTGTGDKKTRQMVRKAHRTNPDAAIAVTGCYAQRAAGELLSLPGVRVVIGSMHKDRVAALVGDAVNTGRQVDAVDAFSQSLPYEPLTVTKKPAHTHAYVKVQDGCARFCSYCVIPLVRGPVRSRPPEDVMREVCSFAEGGCSEVVLTGIHAASYGMDLPGEERLIDVVEAVHRVDGIGRIRLGSLEPPALTDEWIERLAALPKVCDHFHLSLQSGSDAVLKRMRRRYTAQEFMDRVRVLREAFPGCAVTTDVMAGFPGETQEEFEQTVAFVQAVGFARCHVFPYSKRPGTDAAEMPGQVRRTVKEDRARILIGVGRECERAFVAAQVGQVQDVLFEERSGGMLEGYTSRYVRARVPGPETLIGTIAPVCITGAGDGLAYGETTGPSAIVP